MSILYTDLSDVDLELKVKDLTAKYERVMEGGAAVVVAGEGRRVEYTRANDKGLLALLTAARREQQRRAGVQVSGAIQVTFPYAGDY